jgi:inosine-uridine nucleoside N-ribohydrolase/formylmethanofuran dehydrogenase subunit E
MRKHILILGLLLITITLSSHPWKPTHYVVIDTDGGIDDMRAITLLLASPDVRVLGIIASPGAVSADSAYAKVKRLLFSFYHEGLPVAINRGSAFRSPEFPAAMALSWGKGGRHDPQNAKTVSQLLGDIFTHEKTPVSLICLGSLSTASAALREVPAFSQHVKQIIWSSGEQKPANAFNYSIDKSSADNIMKAKVPLVRVGGFTGGAFFDKSFQKTLSGSTGPYAAAVTALFSGVTTEHQYLYEANDEMIPVFLHFPQLFSSAGGNLHLPAGEKLPELKESFIKIISGETVQRNQVIREFPTDPSFYFEDIEPSVSIILRKYGRDEWTSGVLANELHRHLGIFAIIGVKMGIRAREYFNTGVDEFRAVSFAGSIPPLSCMNDGLQVSTGATPGHGLLTVINDSPAPSVEFTYMNHRIRITLKPAIAEKISSELKEINFVYGLDSNIYWELVRKNTIRYWLELDRHEIFEIEELL